MTIDAFELSNIITCSKNIMDSIEYCRYDRTKLMASVLVGYLVKYISTEDQREIELNKIIEIAKQGLENNK